ncbi:MAG: hypothetical protein AB7S65_07180 [Sulfuricurvum sp.]
MIAFTQIRRMIQVFSIPNVNIVELAKLRYILEEETNLPYFFDIVIYDRVENEAFQREIDMSGEKFL